MRRALRAAVRLDSVGAVFVAVGTAGLLWCAWVVVDRQLAHELDSAAGRSDLVLDLTPVFILATVLGSLGVALRVTAAVRSASTIRIVGRPVGAMLVVLALITLAFRVDDDAASDDHAVFVVDDRDPVPLDFFDLEPRVRAPLLPFDPVPAAPAYEFVLRADGCAVSPDEPEWDRDLLWMVTDDADARVAGIPADSPLHLTRPGSYTVVLIERIGDRWVQASDGLAITC